MKKYFLILIFQVLINFAIGQTEKLDYKKIADSFEKYYNEDNFDAIFLSFSSTMQNALPLEEAKNFFAGLKTEAGKITKRNFVKYQQTVALYKTNFERKLFIVKISIDNNSKINGLLIEPEKANLPTLARNKTKLILPFKDEWTVHWGGDTKELNYHVESIAQKNAFDMAITNDKGNTYKTDGKTNDDYYAFGKDLIAPCDGEVVLVVDGIKDNVPGTLNPIYIPGNTVILKTQNNEYLFFAHFKQHSIVVKEGQKIKQGQLLGLCGNSGNSSEPHLHFHIQNVEDMNDATGVKCYFEKIVVNGQMITDYSPIKNEKVSNGKN